MNRPADGEARISILFSEKEIAARVASLAREIAARMEPDLLVIPILNGSFIFAADLLRALHSAGVAPEVDFISLSSYGTETVSSGRVSIIRDTEAPIANRPVLLVDDILESGRTLAFARDLMSERGALSVRTCVLLDKPHRRVAAITPDFTGFTCPDRFVVGYGMDVAHRWRELPFIGFIDS